MLIKIIENGLFGIVTEKLSLTAESIGFWLLMMLAAPATPEQQVLRKSRHCISSLCNPIDQYVGCAILLSCGKHKNPPRSLCILGGEIGGTKTSAENLFSLPICVIMG